MQQGLALGLPQTMSMCAAAGKPPGSCEQSASPGNPPSWLPTSAPVLCTALVVVAACRFPDFSLLSPSNDFTSVIDAVFISHFHMDHVGALPYFTEVGSHALTSPLMQHAARSTVQPRVLSHCCQTATGGGGRGVTHCRSHTASMQNNCPAPLSRTMSVHMASGCPHLTNWTCILPRHAPEPAPCDCPTLCLYPWQVCGYNGPVFMTHPTRAIAPLMLHDFYR